MPKSPFDGLFDKVKKSTQNTATQMGLATKIAKLNVEIATQKAERERHLKNIGTKTYAIFSTNKQAESKVVADEIMPELGLIERIDAHIAALEKEIAQIKTTQVSSEEQAKLTELTSQVKTLNKLKNNLIYTLSETARLRKKEQEVISEFSPVKNQLTPSTSKEQETFNG